MTIRLVNTSNISVYEPQSASQRIWKFWQFEQSPFASQFDCKSQSLADFMEPRLGQCSKLESRGLPTMPPAIEDYNTPMTRAMFIDMHGNYWASSY